MKKALNLLTALLHFAVNSFSFSIEKTDGLVTNGGGVSIIPYNKYAFENMAQNDLSNYNGAETFIDENFEEEFNGPPVSKEKAIYTITITNSAATEKTFYLFSGLLLEEANLVPLTVTGLLGWGAFSGTTVPQTPAGQVTQGKFYALEDGTIDSYGIFTPTVTPSLTASGRPYSLTKFLSYACKKNNQHVGLIKMTTAVGSPNLDGSIYVAKRTPYHELGNKIIVITDSRDPKFIDQGVCYIPVNTRLTPETEIKMTIAASSSMTLSLYMNGRAV